MRLTQYDFNRHLFLVTPTPTMRPRIPISWSNDQDRPTTIQIPIRNMPKQYATINPLFPNVLIKENGNTHKFVSQYELLKYASKFNITVVNHTEKRGQQIINNQTK